VKLKGHCSQCICGQVLWFLDQYPWLTHDWHSIESRLTVGGGIWMSWYSADYWSSVHQVSVRMLIECWLSVNGVPIKMLITYQWRCQSSIIWRYWSKLSCRSNCGMILTSILTFNITITDPQQVILGCLITLNHIIDLWIHTNCLGSCNQNSKWLVVNLIILFYY